MNHARGSAAWVAGSVALGLSLLVAWTGRAHVGTGTAVADLSGRPLQATATATEIVVPTDIAPTAEPSAPALCRVVADPLQVVEAPGGARAISTLQNVGATPVSLSALQIAWSGGGYLTEVSLGPAEGADVLLEGMIASPASVGLKSRLTDGEPWLAAGATVQLQLRFAGVAAADLSPGPTVLHLRQGCSVALHPNPASTCGLQTTDVRVSANDERRVVLAVRNRGSAPTELRALDVYWPDDVNGALRAIVLGGQTRRDLGTNLSSPAVLVVDRVFGAPVGLAPGESLSIWLEFENRAAERPYVVTVVTANGCQASSTTWLDAPGCGVRAGEFETRGLRARLTLSNLLPAPQTPTSLDVFWPVGVNGALIGVTLDGTPVWRGRQESSPAALSLSDAPAIAPHGSALLELSFAPVESGSGTTTPSEETIAADDYTVVIGLSGGCRLVFSTLRGPAPGCRVTAGALLPIEDRPEVEAALGNTGGEARLRRLLVSWPSRNGALLRVSLGDEVLFDGSQAPGVAPYPLLTAPGSGVLASQSTLPLRLAFEHQASRGGYALTASFVDANGAACSDLVITSASPQTGCRLSIVRVDQEAERLVDVFVRNDGVDELELSFVNVAWPAEEGRNELVRVLLVQGDLEQVLWTGQERRPPARIALDGSRAAFVAPGETVRLRLQFTLLGDIPDPSAVVKLTVGTVEGCQAFFPDDNRDTRPVRESFNGLILGFPADGLWGWWTIQAQSGAARESRQVLVKTTTRVDPPTVNPAVGDLVLVEAIQYADGWHAESIGFRGFGQRVQLVGPIEEMDRSSSGARPAWIRVSGYAQRLWIVSDTYVEGRLGVGTRVLVIGTLDANGGVTAISITVQDQREPEMVTVRGTVQSARTAPELGEGWQLWVLGKYYVRADTRDSATRLEEPRGRLPQTGERLEVRGWLLGDAITATQVKLLARRSVVQIVGTAVSVPGGTTVGTWTVRDDKGVDTSFAVESSAVVDTRSAPAVVGVLVRATLERSGAERWTALFVQTDWPAP